jgi:hypothetical protein
MHKCRVCGRFGARMKLAIPEPGVGKWICKNRNACRRRWVKRMI